MTRSMLDLLVLLESKIFASSKDFWWGSQSWLPPPFQAASVWLQLCCFVGQALGLRRPPRSPVQMDQRVAI
jgi:hypothetical protein